MAQNMQQANIQYLPQWRALGNTGDLPVGWTPPSGTPGGATTPVAPTVTTPDFAAAYKTAQNLLPNSTGGAIDDLSSVAANITKSSQDQAAAIRAQEPTVQNIYGDLAKTLEANKQADTSAKQKEGTGAIASQQEQAAESGFDPTQGFQGAMARSLKGSYDASITKIAQNYGLQEDQLTQEESKDIQTLEVDAQNAIATGNKQVADITYQQISLRQAQDTLLANTATAIMGATTDAEKLAIQQKYQNQQVDLQQQQIDLDAKKLAISKYTPVTTYNPTTGQTMVSAFDVQTGQVVGGTPGTASKSASAQYSNPSPTDQSAIAAWATDVKNGVTTLQGVPASIRTAVAKLVQ